MRNIALYSVYVKSTKIWSNLFIAFIENMYLNYINIFSYFSTQCETTQDWRTSMHIWLLFTSVTWLYFHGWITKVHNMTESAVEFQVTATKIS